MKAFKTLKGIKFVLFIIWGILLFIFHDKVADHVEGKTPQLAFLVASLMFAYSIFDFVDMLEKKKTFEAHTKLFDCIIQVVFGTLILAVPAIRDEYATICIIWAVWSICREGEELAEDMERFKEHIPAYLNVIESITVLVLSFMLIASPHEEHAVSHVILLGFELILGVLFPHVDHFFIRRHEAKVLAEKEKEEVKIADEQ